MADKQIRVDEKVHKQIVKIARSNFRGIGDQIAFWASKDCPHPIEAREEKDVTVSIMEDGKSTDQTLRVFLCKQCRRHIVISDHEELTEKLSKIIAE